MILSCRGVSGRWLSRFGSGGQQNGGGGALEFAERTCFLWMEQGYQEENTSVVFGNRISSKITLGGFEKRPRFISFRNLRKSS